MKIIACLFTLLLAACASQPIQPRVTAQEPRVIRYELDANRLKTLNDVKLVLESLRLTYAYREGDNDAKARLQKIEKFLK
jgi:hypothetical protein